MTTYINNIVSIVTAAQRDELAEMIVDLAPEVPLEGALGLWSVPMSMTGEEPATHYGSFGWLDEKLVELLPLGVILEQTDPVFYEPGTEPPPPPPPGPVVVNPPGGP